MCLSDGSVLFRSDSGDGCVGRRLCSYGDAGEALEVFRQLEAPVVAPFVGSEITRHVARIERAAGAGDGALDVAEGDIHPQELQVFRPTAAGDGRRMHRPRIDDAVEAEEERHTEI